jgi:hypothetical protein
VRGTAAALTLQHVIHVEVADLCGARLNIHLTRVNPLGAYFELGRSANVQRSFGSFEKDRAVTALQQWLTRPGGRPGPRWRLLATKITNKVVGIPPPSAYRPRSASLLRSFCSNHLLHKLYVFTFFFGPVLLKLRSAAGVVGGRIRLKSGSLGGTPTYYCVGAALNVYSGY